MLRSVAAILLTGLAACASVEEPLPAFDSPPAPGPALSTQEKEPNWADGLDIEEALSLALARNPRLRSIRFENDAAAAQRVTAEQWTHNPAVTFEASRATPFGKPEDSSVKIGVSQAFEIAGQRGLRIAIADLNRERAAWVVGDAERELRRQTTATFYEVLLAQRRGEIARQNLDLAKRFVEVAEARLAARQIPEIEVNLVRLEHRKVQGEFDRVVSGGTSARARLAALLGEPQRVDLEAKGDLGITLAIVDKEKLAKLALERRPDLQAVRRLGRMAEQRVSLVKASRWPDPVLGVFGEREDSRFSVGGQEESDLDKVFGIELSISLPIFNARQGEVTEAEVDRRRLEAEAAAIEQEIRQDIELGVNRLILAKTTLDLYEKEINRLSRSNLDDFEKAFKAGETGTLEILRSREDFNRSALAYVEAQYELRGALTDLETAAASRISEIK